MGPADICGRRPACPSSGPTLRRYHPASHPPGPPGGRPRRRINPQRLAQTCRRRMLPPRHPRRPPPPQEEELLAHRRRQEGLAVLGTRRLPPCRRNIPCPATSQRHLCQARCRCLRSQPCPRACRTPPLPSFSSLAACAARPALALLRFHSCEYSHRSLHLRASRTTTRWATAIPVTVTYRYLPASTELRPLARQSGDASPSACTCRTLCRQNR